MRTERVSQLVQRAHDGELGSTLSRLKPIAQDVTWYGMTLVKTKHALASEVLVRFQSGGKTTTMISGFDVTPQVACRTSFERPTGTSSKVRPLK